MAKSHQEGAVIAGHFGFAAAVKARAPRTPLWALMLACVWMDAVFIPLFATGIETIVPLPGTSGGYGEGIIHADYTHSLVGALLISVTFALVAALWWRRSVALVLGLVLLGTWLYARAAARAVETARVAGPERARVRYVTAVLLLSGLVTLGLNWFGM